MVESTTRIGFVIDDREWSGSTKLAAVPTAILLPDEDWIAEPMIDRIVNSARGDKITTIIVARPDRHIRGRRLDQTMSRHAPYSEELLQSIASNAKSHE